MQKFIIIVFILTTSFAYSQNSVSISAKDKLVEYELTPLNKINTLKSEFCAVKYGEGIVFVSEQREDLINLESSDVDGHPYLDLFFSKKADGSFTKKKTFSHAANSIFHDGPISFSADLNEAYLTRTQYKVKKNKDFTNQSKLYFLTKKGNHWSKPEKFIYDSDEYSLGHACVSKDGKYLFFASDMKGGFGGTDIYVCERKGDSWDKPVNLGSQVNTAGDELFPHLRRDGVLFFSSNKHIGFGGLDIYSATQVEGKWMFNRNEGIGINSPADDFGIYFTDSVNGYISSSRNGSDDLFSFVFTQKYIEFEGFVLNTKDLFDPSENLKLHLKDSLGNTIKSTRTDNNGYFKFSSLKSDEKYLIDIDETDSLFNGKKQYYFADKSHSIVRVSGSTEKDKFVFKNLPNDPNALPDLDVEDDKTIAGNLLYNNSPSLPYANAKIVAKDDKGNIIDEAVTNEFGAFVFTKIPPGQTILIEIIESDTKLAPGTTVYLTNNKGKTILTTTANHMGKFGFHLLSKDKTSLSEMMVEDSNILLDFRASVHDEHGTILPNLIVYLKNEAHITIDTDTTDANGKIKFNKLLTDKNYIVEFDEADGRLNTLKKIIIKSANGKVVKEIYRINKKFSYHILKGEENELTDIYVDDPWLTTLAFKNTTEKQEVVIEEKLFYAYGDHRVDEAGKKVLDKVIKVMKDNPSITIELSSHTDSRSTDDYNMKLSQKRAQSAVTYIVSHGVDKKRLTAIGYGESKLKNKCTNDASCTEEEHAVNRRTEFKVISGGK